jgi:DNA polymerase V
MRGGKRDGAGRKLQYDSPTKVIRVPEDRVEDIKAFLQGENEMALPLFACAVSAGFPSPADDYMECKLDLNEHLIKRPSATFFARASGDSMIGAGIHDGDLLIVDRSISPENGKIVIAAVFGDLTVKRYVRDKEKAYLYPENSKYKPIEITGEEEVYVWGVVTNVVHKV